MQYTSREPYLGPMFVRVFQLCLAHVGFAEPLRLPSEDRYYSCLKLKERSELDGSYKLENHRPRDGN